MAKRRKFTTAYMQRIVREADACTAPGAIGALLRREGLYSSHLSKWRQLVAASEAAIPNTKRGPKPDAAKAVDRRVANLELTNEKLTKQLERAKLIIAAQKKPLQSPGLANGRGFTVMEATSELVGEMGVRAACASMGLARGSYYRARRENAPGAAYGTPSASLAACAERG